MNEEKCDEEIFQDHREQELAAAATRTTQIQNTGLIYAISCPEIQKYYP